MADFGALGGAFAYLQSFFLWQVISQVVSTMLSPAFAALQQDALAAHPDMVLTPDILARAVVQSFMTKAAAQSEANKSGIDNERFGILLDLATIRIQPADLAEAVLRSYVTSDAALVQAREQGISPAQFEILTLLAGDGIGPQQAAEARRRGYIKASGTGPDSTSYEQAIAESRLHNKWADTLYLLTQAILSPPDAAQAVVRGFLTSKEGETLAALSGVDASTFTTMTNLAGDAPSPTELAEALRREIIPLDSGSSDKPGFIQGIQQGRLANKWVDMVQQLSQMWPTPTDALEARLVGQIDDTESQSLYKKFGGDPTYWQLLFDTRGESPTPLELGVIANRGVIGWDGLGADKTTFQQGFFEGRWRDKWLPVYRELAKFRPSESAVTLFLSHGVIDDATAADMLAKLGMDGQTVEWYVDEAHLEAYSDYRGITVSTVLQAYHEQILSNSDALAILTGLHVDSHAAAILLELQDIQRAFEAMNSAITRIRSLYAARKITLQTVRKSLADVGVDGTQIEGIVQSWQVENSVSVKVLTEAQITKAWSLGLLTEDEAFTELENLGYSPLDAWVLLSLEEKAPARNKPAQGPPPLQGAVIPGTT